MISSLSVQQRALPPPPTTTISCDPVEEEDKEEDDDLYVSMKCIKSSSLPRSGCVSTDVEPIVCQPSTSDKRSNGDYVFFHPSLYPLEPCRQSFDSKSESSRCSDRSNSTDDDGVYAEPYSDILVSTSHGMP